MRFKYSAFQRVPQEQKNRTRSEHYLLPACEATISLAREAKADSPPAGRLAASLESDGSLGFHHMLPTHLITSASLLGACLHNISVVTNTQAV